MIIGCGGAGKSTLAQQLSTKLNLELIALDQLYWRPNWTETPKEEWIKIVEEAAQKKNWIMDGNYSGTMDLRIKKATHIIFLDFPTWLCLFRILKRTWRFYGQPRPEMPENCPERFDWGFTHYVLTYRRIRRPRILNRLKGLSNKKQLFILKNPKEVHQFLERISTK